MAKRGPNKRRRIPKLCFTTTEGIGYYATYRDPRTGTPRRHRFGIKEKSRLAEAELAYHKWLAEYLQDGPSKKPGRPVKAKKEASASATLAVPSDAVSGSVLEVASAFLDALESRVRQPNAPRARGTIAPAVFSDRRKHVRDFLQHLNRERGEGTIPSDNDSLLGPLDHARTDQPTHRRQTLPGIRIAGEPGELSRPERRLASWPVRSPTLQHLDDAEPGADVPQPQVTASIRRPAPYERRRLDHREAAMHAAALDPRSMPGALGSLLCS